MPINYQLGKIYTVVNTENDIAYVGSTAQKYISSRMVSHRVDALDPDRTSPWNVAMRTIGVEKFRIILHHAYPCNSKDELEAEEYRTLDAIIASGKQVYNDKKQGKVSEDQKKKIAKTLTGHQVTSATRAKIASSLNSFGSLKMYSFNGHPRWVFSYVDESRKRYCRSFAVSKYGEYGALFRAEEARRAVYPEWGNEEDIACDDLGHIEWD